MQRSEKANESITCQTKEGVVGAVVVRYTSTSMVPTTSTRDRKDNQILCESKRFPIFVFSFIFFILAKHSKRFAFFSSSSILSFAVFPSFLHHHGFSVYARVVAYVCKAQAGQGISGRIYFASAAWCRCIDCGRIVRDLEHHRRCCCRYHRRHHLLA